MPNNNDGLSALKSLIDSPTDSTPSTPIANTNVDHIFRDLVNLSSTPVDNTPSTPSTGLVNKAIPGLGDTPVYNKPDSIASSEGPGFWSRVFGHDAGTEKTLAPGVKGLPDARVTTALDKARKDIEGKITPQAGSKDQLDPYKTIYNGLKAIQPDNNISGSSDYNLAPETIKELKDLGFENVLNPETNKIELLPINKPNLNFDQISTKLTNLNKLYQEKRIRISKQINDITSDNFWNKITGFVAPESGINAFGKTDQSQRNTLSEQLKSLDSQYQEMAALYKQAGMQQTFYSEHPAARVTSSYLSDNANAPMDFNKFSKAQKAATSYWKNLASKGPKGTEEDMTKLGINYSYMEDMPSQILAEQAWKRPTGGIVNKATPQVSIDRWTLTGVAPNIKSLQSNIDYDVKIGEKLEQNKANLISKIIKANPNITKDKINEVLDSTGISDASNTLQENINYKRQVLNNLKSTITGGVKDLVNYNATEKLYSDIYKNSPISTNIVTSLSKVGEEIDNAPGFAGRVLQGWFGNSKGNEVRDFKNFKLSGAQVTEPLYEKTLEDGSKIMVPISEKVTGLYDEKNDEFNVLDPSKWNVDVMAGHATKMAGDIMLLEGAGRLASIGTGLMAESTLAKSLELGQALEAEGALGGKWYTMSNYGTKALSKATVGTLGYAVPSILLFGPDNVRNEINNKGLSVEDGIKLGTVRSAIEGYAFAINPIEIAGAARRLAIGEIKDATEDAIYNRVMKANWTRLTGSRISDKAYNLLFNMSYIPKAVGESALNLSIQQNLALAGNSLISKYYQDKHPDYYDPEHELTAKNIFNTTVSAIATAIPFGLMHAMGKKNATDQARNSALFRVVQSPEWHIRNIDDRLSEGEISPNEALRQHDLITKAKVIYDSIRPDLNEIMQDPHLSMEEKHDLQLKKFTNEINKVGIISELAKDISPEERERLTTLLKVNAEEAHDIISAKEKYYRMSTDDKLKVDAIREFENYRETYLNEDLTSRYTVDDFRDRKNDLEELVKNETNPYLSAKYYDMSRAIDMHIQDQMYKDSKDPRHIKDAVSGFVDWLDEQSKRTIEEYDNLVRHGQIDFDGTSYYDFKKSFIEDNMDVQQRFLYNNYQDQVMAEQARRNGEEAPTEEPTVVEDEDVDPLDKLISLGNGDIPEESRPTRQPEPTVNDQTEIPNTKPENVKKINISDINTSSRSLDPLARTRSIDNAIANIESGITPTTEGPPKLYLDKNGKYSIQDGYHRVAQAILNGETSIDIDEIDAPTETKIVPIAVINSRQAKINPDYIALSESENDVKTTNNAGLFEVHKLAGFMYDVSNDGKKLVEAATAIAYAARPAEQNLDGSWGLLGDNLDPNYQALHSRKFYQTGTAISFKILTPEESKFFKDSQEQFLKNEELVELHRVLTYDEFKKEAEDPNNFVEIQVLDSNGNIIGYIHGLDYIREARVVPEVYTVGGDPINNIKNQFNSLKDLRRTLIAQGSKGPVDGVIGSTAMGSISMRADGKYVPIKTAVSNPNVLKAVTIVSKPSDIRHEGKQLANWKSLTLGSIVSPRPTPNNQAFGVTIQRAKLGKEFSESILNVIRIFTQYKIAKDKGDSATLDRLDELMDQYKDLTDDPYRWDFRDSFDGMQWYINNVVHAGSKSSDYLSSVTREEVKDVPFIDLDMKANTITWSNKRDFSTIDKDKKISGSDFETLKNIGVHRQLLFVNGEINPGLEYFLKDFGSFLKDRNLNFKRGNLNIKGKFQIPLFAKEGDSFKLLDNPKEAKNSGTSYHDYILNNSYTNTLEHEISNPDGSKEYVYMEQPTKQFKVNVTKEEDAPDDSETETLTDVEQFIEKFKGATTYTEAKELAEREGVNYPGIDSWIKKSIKDKRNIMTYEEKKLEFDRKWADHNKLAGQLDYFNNSLTKSKKRSEEGVGLEREINNLSSDLGYKITIKNSGRLVITTDVGTKLTRKSFPTNPSRVVDDKLTFYGQQVGKEDGMLFRASWHPVDVYNYQLDFQMSRGEIESGFKAIEAGRLSSVKAQSILERIARWKSLGYVVVKRGAGKFIDREHIPYSEYVQAVKVSNEFDDNLITEQELDELAYEYDKWFKSLSPEDKQEHIEQYENEKEYKEEFSSLEEGESESYIPEESNEQIDTKEGLEPFISASSNYADLFSFQNIEDSVSNISDRPYSKLDYENLTKVYNDLPRNIKDKIGSLQDIIEERPNWSEQQIIDWINCK